MSEDWTQMVVQRWLGDLDHTPDGALHILLPSHCKASHAALRGRLEQDWSAAVHIEYHAQERFVFRVGDHVIELDVPVTGERLAPRLATKLQALKSAPQTMDEAGQAALKSWLSSFLADIPAAVEGSDQ